MTATRAVRSRLVIFRSLVVEAGASLRGRRMQAALSGFGIATGIAAVVLLVSLVAGIHRMALQSFNTAGGNVVNVFAETDPTSRDPTGPALSLTPDDAEAVVRASPYFNLASAENGASAVVRGVVIQARTFTFNSSTGRASPISAARAYMANIRGLTPSGFEMMGLRISEGRLPSATEFETAARTVVLGPAAAQQIFGSQPAVGQTVVLGDWPFRVIGVLAWLGKPEGEFRNSRDRQLFMPFRTVAAVFRGNEIASQLSLRIKAPELQPAGIADARGILKRRQVRLGQTSGQIEFVSSADQLREFGLVITGLKLLVGLVGGIGLFVGAVGVANVLLVSVRERTQEIGVRRAVGARRQDVFIGFLLEALAITLGGGLVGIFTAWVLTKIADMIPAIPDGAEPHISLMTAFIAVSILVLVGIVAGVGPARRAASVFPSEALRAE